MSSYAVHFHFFLHYAKLDFIFNGRLLSFKIIYGYMLCVVYIAKCSSDIGKAYSADGWGESSPLPSGTRSANYCMACAKGLLDIQPPFILGQKCLLGKVMERSPCKFLEDIFTVKMKKVRKLYYLQILTGKAMALAVSLIQNPPGIVMGGGCVWQDRWEEIAAASVKTESIFRGGNKGSLPPPDTAI